MWEKLKKRLADLPKPEQAVQTKRPLEDMVAELLARAGARSTPSVANRLDDPRLLAIKALLFNQSKFLSSCLNPLAAWRFEDGEVHFIYPRDALWAVDLMKSREYQEKLTSACEQVLGLSGFMSHFRKEEAGLQFAYFRRIRASGPHLAQDTAGVTHRQKPSSY